MRSLFWKLFGAFWLTTLVILAASIFVSFRIADEQSPYSFADPREIDELLQVILGQHGIDGLEAHISNPQNFPPGQTVYLIDSNGLDLLERRPPERVHSRARRIWSAIENRSRDRRHSDQASRWLRQSLLVTADGRMLLAMPGPAPHEPFGFLLGGNGRWAVLGLAAAISSLGFWLLSRSLTRPVSRISETARRLAAGDMTARVGTSAYSHDEIGQLAVQFDRMAEDLDTQSGMRREMFRNIVHEVRAPLTRLQIATELLQRKPERSTANVERIRREIERIETLASRVLELARAEQVLDPKDLTLLSEVAQKIARDAEFEAASHKVRLQYAPPEGNPQVRGSPDAVSSAIENVVRNAIQHTPAGGEVSLCVASGSPCTVTVSDTGPGVPNGALKRIFEPFYRIDTNLPGAGIGLAIAHRTLHQLGGYIKAENRPEGGLEVTMSFPLSAEQ